MDKKGRRVKARMYGEKNSAARLTENQVRQILTEYKPWTVTRPMLAIKYGVSEPLIDKIVDRKLWKYL
jgi:ribosomal protein S25